MPVAPLDGVDLIVPKGAGMKHQKDSKELSNSGGNLAVPVMPAMNLAISNETAKFGDP